jgi:tetratricopeptide (TPR) repeat protein
MTQTGAAVQKQRGLPRAPKRDLLGPDVGRRIKAARIKRGMTLVQVGGDELSRSFLSLVESGRSRISLRALAIVAEQLETPISHFLEDKDEARVAELSLDYAEIELEGGKPAETIKIIDGDAASYGSNPRAQWLLGRALVKVRDQTKAVAVLRKAVELSGSGTDQNLSAEILYSLGGCLYAGDNYEEAAAYFHEGLQLALREPENPGLQARLFIAVGHSLYVLNKPSEAIAQYDRAREIFGSLYDLNNVGAVFSAMSLASRKQGDLDAALKYSKQSVATFRLKRDWRQVARELNNMAMRHMERGELDTARERAEEAVQRAHEVDAPDIEAYGRGTLASVYLRQGCVEEAEREAAAAELLASDETPLARVDALIVRAEVAAMSRQADRVDELYTEALHALRDLGHNTRLADTSLRYSLLLRQRGDLERALDMALQAADARGGRIS